MNISINGSSQKNQEMNAHVTNSEKNSVKSLREQKAKEKAKEKTLKGYKLNLAKDPMQQKIEKARQEAMKKLTDVLNYHMEVNDDMETRAKNIKELDKEILANQKELEKLAENKKAYTEEHAGKEITEEYKQEMKNFHDQEQELQKRVNEAKGQREAESKTIEATHLALLKADPMVAAKKDADKIMETANKEVVGDLLAEGKENIEDKMEEEVEKAQEKKEEEKKEELKKALRKKEQEQLEERIENNQANLKNPQEVEAENASLNEANDVLPTVDNNQNKLQQEARNIIKAQQLVEDDLKGLQVDQVL